MSSPHKQPLRPLPIRGSRSMANPVPILDDLTALHSEKNQAAKVLKVCLITSLSVVDFIDPDLTAEGAQQFLPGHIGILTLAAVLRQFGYDPTIVNLDRLFLQFRQRPASGAESDREQEQFYSFVLECLGTLTADVFGFSSICSSYPLTLRLAQEMKRLNPTSYVILGGPQATVVDVATLTAFPSVDFVVRGEADRTLTALLRLLSGDDRGWSLRDLPGITFRENGEIVRNDNAPVIEDLDALPLPAFDLDAEMASRESVHIEIGRGCPFACTFCSTNDFFRRSFRVKSPRKMVEEMRLIKERYGISHFSLIHDMYTVNRKKVIAFCEALLACSDKFEWACSARADCIDNELIQLMAKAGCRGIFFGIETGSARMQQVINKKLDLTEARQRIQCASEHEIKTAVALICGFPEERRDDLRDTIHFFIDSTRFDHAEPQLSLLAPLAATPIYEQHKGELVLDEIFSDMSHQGWGQDPADLALIKLYPDVFPNFYAVPTHENERTYLKEVRDFVTYLCQRFRWLPVALLRDSGDFLNVFDSWRSWSVERKSQRPQADCSFVPYYCSTQFREDFIEFVRAFYIEKMANSPMAIAALLQNEVLLSGATPRSADLETIEQFNETSFPFQAQGVTVVEFEIDYQQLIQSLRADAERCSVERRSVAVASCHKGDKKIEVRQLSELASLLIRLCDGSRTVEEVVRAFASYDSGVPGVSPEAACLFGLMVLREDGLLQFASQPIVAPSITDDAPVASLSTSADLPSARGSGPRANASLNAPD
jgi:radical SAM superfamily enzyme YgiQ (UPF0313 family)